ncbi:MAG: SusC/RagA family TonB-linked outer membrane protein [Ferruginibacter sp.]
MRRFLTLFSMLMLCGVLAFAQSRVVSGKVTDKDGNVVPFASVKIKGSKTGAQADANGAYTIKVKDGDVLEISATSFKSVEAVVGGQSIIITSLEKTGALTEVVVTSAFGIKRTARSTSSNAQVVNAEQLNTVRQTNVNNALAGKVSGIQVRSQSSAALGRETNIRVRGESSAGGGASSPIYVVDGTIMPNNSDINPDDIEDISVLQGPQAAALFGPDGANGAIVISTRKGKKGAKGIGVDINSGVQFDKIYILPNYQNAYAGGGSYDMTQFTWKPGMPELWKSLDGKYMPDYADDASWGPRMVGQEYIPWYAWYPGTEYSGKTASLNPQPNNARDFFNTGVTLLNNISLSKVTDNSNIRVSYTNQDLKGLIPTSYLKRHNLNLNASFDLSTHWLFSTNITYINQKSNAENDDGYSNNSTGNFNSWFHRDLDMNKMRELAYLTSPDGSTLASWNHSSANGFNPATPNNFYRGNYWYNPYAYYNNININNNRDRLFGDLSLTYKVNNDISIRGTYRKQQLTTNEERFTRSILQTSAGQASINLSYVDPNGRTNDGKAMYGTGQSFSNRNVYEVVGSYRKKIKDFQINGNAGIEIVRITGKNIFANTLGGFSVPDLYTLSNSVNPIGYANTRSEEKRRAIFARGDIGWKNMVFAEFVTRNDWSSTLPVGTSLFSQTYGASFVFSDLIKNSVPWISYGKIRGSYGQVPRFIGAYALSVNYGLGTQTWNGNGLMGTPNSFPDPSLKGALASTTEFGLDLRFLKNRIGLSATYYIGKDEQSPINGQVSGTTGVTSVLGNFGSTRRKGLDFQLNLKPIQTKNLSWEFNATFSKLLENVVTAIAPGVDQLAVSGGSSFNGITPPITVNAVGKQWGLMYGGGVKRINGQPVIDADGLYVKDPNLVFFGSVLPDYTGGVQNSFNIFKNFIVNINIDYQVGGKFFSLSDMWGSYSGLLARTAQLNDKGNSIRDAVADGGGIKTTGVDDTGKPVEFYVEAQDYFHSLVERNIFDDYMYDLTFVKLRELSLGYRIPVSKLKVGKFIQNATFSIVARNPWLIYAKTRDFDPSEINSVFGEDGQLPGTRSIGVNLKIGF